MNTSSPANRAKRGKSVRSEVPRSSHGNWSPAPDRADPVALLEEQAESRVPELVPIRHGRMAASPFAFFRGAALPMAADLDALPHVPLKVQLCGDAHLSNFGGFASPERDLVFDVNDFDETTPGPFDWDLKRLAASIEIAARGLGLSHHGGTSPAKAAATAYRTAMRSFAQQSNLDVWYARLDVDKWVAQSADMVGRAAQKKLEHTITKAHAKDRLKAAARLTRQVEDRMEFVSDPPLIVPVEELLGDTAGAAFDQSIHKALRAYAHSLPADRRHLLATYRYARLARKVVGVGSVGTRAWVALLEGRDRNDPLFLQIKEAQASVLEPFVGRSGFDHHGQRVVEGQRMMQATGDILLGFDRITGTDGITRDFYVRQLWDWKASADIESLDETSLTIYAQICGWTLARAHARSGDRIAIASYLGAGGTFDEAIGAFASAYADQNDKDHRALTDAIEQGRVQAQFGV